MPVTCTHLADITGVEPGQSVCPECVAVGSRWVHLRQCMSCGQTGCCTSSPNSHASRHADEAGHPIMRSLQPGEDWMWCFPDEQQFRRAGDRFLTVDPFLEVGLWYAHDATDGGRPLPDADGAVTPDGFPFGEWLATYRGARDRLDPEQVDALEAVPGWTWADTPST